MKLSRLVCILGFCFWSNALTLKYYFFGFYDWDFALYSQAMWGLCHGTSNVSLFGTSFLADHAHFIAFLITPVYFVFRHPLTLIYLEVFSFFAGAYILFLLAKKLTSENIAFGLMVIYILHPANIFMLMYEFHFESLAIGLIFLLFYFHYLKNYKAFMITALILMLIKENMPVIVFMLGVHGLLLRPGERIKWGLVPLVLGLGMFILTMFIIMPMVRHSFSSHQNIYWGLYHSFGDTPSDILKTLIFNPKLLIKVLATWQNLYFMRDVLGGFSFGAFFSPSILFVGAPLFLQNLLSNAAGQHKIYFHYAATLIPFAAISAAYGFAFLKKRYQPWLCTLLLLTCLFAAGDSFINNLPIMRIKANLCIDHNAYIRQALIDKIPPDAGVVASFRFLSHLTRHHDLYALYNVWRDINYFTGQVPRIPSEVHYALVDFYDPWLRTDTKDHLVVVQIKDFLASGGWKAKYTGSGITLFER
ncbi:MAG: DUF2079 domain-containing protein [Candidatus Omnitrophica bacterium]|nr:DUF2079 domain-containing protein [Candidatus Omnitrophota bacterium]